MKIYQYSFFFRFIYRYGNIPVSIILLFYLIPAVINLDKNIFYVIPLIITLVLIYLINKMYLYLYKILPYKIEVDDEKLVCSDFLFSKRKVTIFFNEITSLTGGIFDGKLHGVMKIFDKRNQMTIGFFNKIKNAKQLETLILSKVSRELYDEVVDRVGFKNKRKVEK
jgi:hypothetical protein